MFLPWISSSNHETHSKASSSAPEPPPVPQLLPVLPTETSLRSTTNSQRERLTQLIQVPGPEATEPSTTPGAFGKRPREELVTDKGERDRSAPRRKLEEGATAADNDDEELELIITPCDPAEPGEICDGPSTVGVDEKDPWKLIKDLRLRLEHSEDNRRLLSAKLSFTTPTHRYENSQGYNLWSTERTSLETTIRLLESAVTESSERETKLAGKAHDLGIKLAAQQTDYERAQVEREKERSAQEWEKTVVEAMLQAEKEKVARFAEGLGVDPTEIDKLKAAIARLKATMGPEAEAGGSQADSVSSGSSSSTAGTDLTSRTSEHDTVRTTPGSEDILDTKVAESTGPTPKTPTELTKPREISRSLEAEVAGLRVAREVAKELEDAIRLGRTLRKTIEEKDEVIKQIEGERKKSETLLGETQRELDEKSQRLDEQQRHLGETRQLLETTTRELEDLREEDFQMGQMVLKVTAKLLTSASEPVPDDMRGS